MRRLLFLIHRYLGIGIGLIMAMWCLSGFVMMYMPYPNLSQEAKLAGSPPLDLRACCETGSLEGLGLVDVYGFSVEMLSDRPVLRVRASGGKNPIVDLGTGEVIDGVGPERAELISKSFREQLGLAGDTLRQELVVQDQWTVTRAFDPFRPFYKFSADDPQGTEWYVASTTGEIVQLTTATQRFWNWLGAVPHWLYPTALRQHDQLWSQLVIWLSLAGVFLTIVGLYIGLLRYRKLPSGRRSPYRGVGLWHHYAGLVFGIFVLTWVASGFFSMNPWGMFDFGGGEAARKRLQGVPLYSGEVASLLETLPQRELPRDTVKLEGYTLGGRLYVLAWHGDGKATRLSGADLRPAPLTDWSELVAAAAGRSTVLEAGLLSEEDAYYYTGHELQAHLPVYRIVLDNRDRLYLNSTSGELDAYFDESQKLYRWLFSGLHSLDFTGWIRSRPFWDLIVWLLMLGVSAATLTGAYMGVRRLVR
ncbi:peptidase [Proteobacteria bacterium 005FR1]|nr:peptidase [Proteobacteria bacterium 005FR1]